MKKILVLSLSLILLEGCGPKAPCSGGGLSVDNSQLTGDWLLMGGVPDGGTACNSELDQGPTVKQFDYPALEPHPTMELWRKHLAVNGWKTVEEDLLNESGFTLVAEKNGKNIQVFISKMVDKGWVTVDLPYNR